VNAEYNAKLDVVVTLNADLDGMAQATGIATLFIDAQQQLVRFTPEAAALFRLRPDDIGRPIGNFSSPIMHPGLLDDLAQVLAGGPLIEREVAGLAGGRYLMRILGYADRPGAGHRAVLTLIDISRLRDARRLQAAIDSLPEHLAMLDIHGTVRRVNRAWDRFASQNGGGPEGVHGLSRQRLQPGIDVLGAFGNKPSVLTGAESLRTHVTDFGIALGKERLNQFLTAFVRETLDKAVPLQVREAGHLLPNVCQHVEGIASGSSLGVV